MPVGRVHGKTNADGERGRIRLLVQTTADALGDVLCAFVVGIEQKNGEFITAVTSGNFRATAVFLHHTGQAIQCAIPCQVAEAVVNAFQVVEIQKKQGKRLVGAVGTADFTFQALEEFPI